MMHPRHSTLSQSVVGHMDLVEFMSNTSGTVIFEGWFITDNMRIHEIIMKSNKDGRIVNTFPIESVRLDRPDVIYDYKHTANHDIDVQNLYGFSIQCNLPMREWVNIAHGGVTLYIDELPIFDIDMTTLLKDKMSDWADEILSQKTPLSTPKIIVVDNIYEQPDAVRLFALSLRFYSDPKFFKGKRTHESYIPSWIRSTFEHLLQRKISEMVGATGIFQFCSAEDPVVYHYDTQEYAAMIYLTPDAPLQSGTSTYRSKKTGLYGAATEEDARRRGSTVHELDCLTLNSYSFYDRHNYELVDQVANVYNRLILFQSRSLHAATSYFGRTLEDSRLFHLFFFNLVPYS